MKTLYILRHAEAMPNTSSGDFERSLTPRGLEAAKALGLAMKGKNYAPALAVCSSAKRTSQTLEGILQALTIPAIQYDKAIYHAAPPDLLDYIRALDDKHESALIVGHNPTVHETAAMLAADDVPDFSAQLARGYPPGTLTVLQVPRASWSDLQPGENHLKDILSV